MGIVQGLKKKSEELSILCAFHACFINTDPSSSSSYSCSSPSSSSSGLCYSWPEDLEACVSFNHQKEMMIAEKKRKIGCLSSSNDEKFKKPKLDSSLSDDDFEYLLSMIDFEEKPVEEEIRLLTDNQPKETEGVEQVEILGSDHSETIGFEGLEMVSELGNVISVDLYDDGFQKISSDVDSSQNLVEQSDKILGSKGKISDDLEMINGIISKNADLFNELNHDYELQRLLSKVYSTQNQVEQSDEILSFEGQISEDSEMTNGIISENIDLYIEFDDDYELQCLFSEVDPTQIQVEQSDGILSFEGQISEDLEMISKNVDLCNGFDDDYGLECLFSDVDPTQIQFLADEPEKAHDQAEIWGCGKKDFEETEMMINENISDHQNWNDMEWLNLVNFEQDFQGIPNTCDDHLMQGSCNFSENYQTLSDSWQKLPQLI